MMHVGYDTTEESNRAIKRTKKVHGVIEYMYRETVSEIFFTLCPCCTNYLSKPACLVALQGFKIPSRPACGNFLKRDDRKGLIREHVGWFT
jgi:hypothetical protein